MPAKNSVKQFIENGCYHLYNRGVEKRNIFLDSQDYNEFISYLKKYLDPLGSDPKSLAGEVVLIAFCLMQNHFHLLVKQTTINGITRIMRAVCTKYAMYFNRKYGRVGTLFQGKYKACLVSNDAYLLHLSRYIHLNPYPGSDPKLYQYSSYRYYLGEQRASWLNPELVLNFFHQEKKLGLMERQSYQNFVEDLVIDSRQVLEGLVLE